jgi:hypothetical protein
LRATAAPPPVTSLSVRVATRARSEARAAHAITLLVAAVVLGQRVVLPVGPSPIPLVLPVLYVAVAVLWSTGSLRSDRVRTELFFLGAGACLLAAVAAIADGRELVLTSLLYLFVIYVPWTLTVRDASGRLYHNAIETFLRLMTFVSAVALLQMAVQLAGGPYIDPFELMPQQLVAEDYMTTYEVVYGSPIMKANGAFMLEPSFLSQFAALAIIVTLATGRRLTRLPLYGAALLASVSGTGLVLLGFGIGVAVLRRRISIGTVGVLGLAALTAVVVASPLGGILLERTDEVSTPGSSGHLRFVAPYEEVARALQADPAAAFTGFGSGMTERLLESGRTGGAAIVYPIAGKLVFEYGIVAGTLFAAFIVVAVTRGTRAPPVPAACLLMLFVLSGALLQPHTVAVAWLLTSLFARPWRDDALRAVLHDLPSNP